MELKLAKDSVAAKAARAGVHRTTYYAVLSGRGCSRKTAEKIAKIEGVHVHHVMWPHIYDTKGRMREYSAGAVPGSVRLGA